MISKEELIVLYINENKTTQEIADMYGITAKRVRRRLKEYNIEKSKSLIEQTRINKCIEKSTKVNITKEELYELYINQNKTPDEIAAIYNCTGKTIREHIQKHNIEKSKEDFLKRRFENLKKTSQEKYNTDFPIQSKEVKEKIKQTNIERYGVPNAAQSDIVKQRTKENNIKKYGVSHPLKLDEYKEKVRENSLKEKGFAYPLQKGKDIDSIVICSSRESLKKFIENNFSEKPMIEEVANKLKYAHCTILALLKEYDLLDKVQYYPHGTYSQLHLDKTSIEIVQDKDKFKEYLKSFEEKPSIFEVATSLGYSRGSIKNYIAKYSLEEYINYTKNNSTYENIINQALGNIFYKTRKIISPLEIDLYNDDLKLGIEFNGNYWHRVENKGPNFHLKKTEQCSEKGIRLIHIFQYEWDDPVKRSRLAKFLIKTIEPLHEIRDYTIREIDNNTCREFLNTYHLSGEDKSAIKLGCFSLVDDSLITVVTLKKPTTYKEFDYQISRLCSSYSIIHYDKLFEYIYKNYSKSLIVYCDRSKFTGTTYQELGFSLLKHTRPDYCWCNYTGEILNRKDCTKQKLYEQYPQYKGLSETEIMHSLGYFKLEDVGKSIYINK